MRDEGGSIMTIETVKKLAAVAAGVGSGPLSLRFFTMLGVPVGGPARDSVVPLAFWLASSPIACCGPVYWRERAMAGRRLRQIETGAAGRRSRRTRRRRGPGVGLRTMKFPAADASLRYDATARLSTLTGAPRRSVASTCAVARVARARSRRAVLRCAPDGCPLRSLSLVAGALHCKRATAHADAPRALVTPAGCARRRRDRGATPQFWAKGLHPKNGAQWERSQNRRPAARAEAGIGESP